MRQRSPKLVRPRWLRSRYVIPGAAAAPLVLAVAGSLAGPQTDRVDRAVLQACIVGVPLAVGLHALRSAHTAASAGS